MNNWKQHLTLKNVLIALVVCYFIFSDAQRTFMNTGADPKTIEFEKYMIETNAKIRSMERADSIHVQNVIDYAKQIIKNENAVDSLDDDGVDALFDILTNGG